jgi:FAD/FMN-containing dehydrogenase
VPLGSCSGVGVAGYALGGGESSLTPKFGYGCDSLMDLKIVTADSKVLRANAREHWQKTGRKKSWVWVERFYRAMEPFLTGAVYVNDLENEGEARVRAAYGAKYDRLSRIKRKFDPYNFFRINQNIPPAAGQ